jgi:hypothetical protein
MTTVKHAVKNAAIRNSTSPNVRQALHTPFPASARQPTIIRAPISISKRPRIRVVESFSPKTMPAIRATNSGMQPGLSAPPS